MEIRTLKDEVRMKNEQIASLEKQIAEFTLSPREKMENQEETVVSLASSTSKNILPFQTKKNNLASTLNGNRYVKNIFPPFKLFFLSAVCCRAFGTVE